LGLESPLHEGDLDIERMAEGELDKYRNNFLRDLLKKNGINYKGGGKLGGNPPLCVPNKWSKQRLLSGGGSLEWKNGASNIQPRRGRNGWRYIFLTRTSGSSWVGSRACRAGFRSWFASDSLGDLSLR